jgi:hypothetical protein
MRPLGQWKALLEKFNNSGLTTKQPFARNIE